MQIRLDIKRRKSAADTPYLQSVSYLFDDINETVATALNNINRGGYKDTDGRSVTAVSWECSCLQKKCGACAMVIGGVPRLACDTKLSLFQKAGFVRIEPLRKFPVISDLTVDRSIMFKNLRDISLWLDEELSADEKSVDTAYDASRCLQCGCCLEVCPNFYAGGKFYGMAAGIAASKLLAQLDKGKRKALAKQYDKHFYSGCGKSLSCKDICPAGIETDALMVNSNALAVFKRLFK